MKIINAGVTAPKGFKCAGLRAGVKPGKTNKDMAMIVSEVPAKIAGTFTKNIVKAAPVLWGKKIVEEQEAVRAVVINTGIANACTGACSIAVGIITLVTGVAAGVLMIVSGSRLLKRKSDILI